MPVWLAEQGFCSPVGISLKKVLLVRCERFGGLLHLLESAAVSHVCQLVSFENRITASHNRCVLPLLMARLGRTNTSEVRKGFLPPSRRALM